MLNVLGHNPYKSGRGIMIPEDSMSKLDADWYMDNLAVRSTVACSPGCLTACRGWYRIKGDESPAAERYAGELGHKPEYGGWSPFAANCAILDFPAVVHMNRLCTRYGFDTMEAGSVIAFLMELWERGIVTGDDMVAWTGEPLSLDWGDYEVVEKVLAAIASQENRLGQILNGSSRTVAERVGEAKGVPVVQFACYGKGGINHDESERGWPSMCSAMALSPIGAHHSKGIGFIEWAAEYFLGTTEAGGMMATKMQGKALAISQNAMAFVNALGMCNFIAGNYGWDPSKVTPELLAEALSAATGVRFTAQDLFEGADRINNVEKAFNSRLGLRRDDDTVCHRWLKEPILEGESRGIKAEDYLEQIKDEYYEYAGWDRDTALQTRERLLELGLEDVAAVLEKENALA